mmetsp:Transcript_4310/g.7663  ORF Transcript_4310/g.7663 Transcript_4310/m.7663 type:complete len:462 (+) Transcript_4310:113-1498(+)
MSMIHRIRRVPLLNSSVYQRTCSATTATAAQFLSRFHALNLNLPQRSNVVCASTVTLSQNTQQQQHVGSYSTASFAANNGSGDHHRPSIQLYTQHTQRREYGSTPTVHAGVKMSTLLAKHLGLSRRQSERMVLTERVTLFGKIVKSPTFELYPSNDPNQNSDTAMKVDGKLVDVQNTLKLLHLEQKKNETASSSTDVNDNAGKPIETENYSNTRIWLANKLKGELITEDDPVGRPSMLQRLTRGGVGKSKKKNGLPVHLIPVGRLDMMTEGLMIFTNDGKYSRQLELPTNKLWRTYRVRVHGRLSMGKLRAMRKGLTVRVNDNQMGSDEKNPSGEVVQMGKMMKYKGIKVSIERKNLSQSRQRGRHGKGGTNTWLQITCAEGKNRQLRRILDALGLDVTRLIRISYGDYDLNTIPAGMAVEVPCKGLEDMRKKGQMFERSKKKKEEVKVEKGSAIQWVNHS